MKKFKFIGAIAFALMLSLNASFVLDGNNWDTSTEIAEAQFIPVILPFNIGPTYTTVTEARPKLYACYPNVPGTIRSHFVGCLNGSTTCNRTNCFT